MKPEEAFSKYGDGKCTWENLGLIRQTVWRIGVWIYSRFFANKKGRK